MLPYQNLQQQYLDIQYKQQLIYICINDCQILLQQKYTNLSKPSLSLCQLTNNNNIMQLRILDFRNAKYQGQTNKQQINGFGMLIDQNYTFVIAEWDTNNQICGNFVIFYANSLVVYGHVNQYIVSCYDNHYLYANYVTLKNQKGICIYENIDNNTIIQGQINTQKQQNPPKTTFKQLQSTTYNQKDNNKFLLIKQYLTQNSPTNQKSTKFTQQYKSLAHFILHRFKQKHHQLLELYQTSKQLRLSFRNQSIFVNYQLIMNKILGMGYYNQYYTHMNTNRRKRNQEIDMQFGRNYMYLEDKSYLVEEFIHSNSQQSASHIQFTVLAGQNQKRPRQCVKSMRQYYKRSLTFVNQYLNLSQIYQINQKTCILHKIIKDQIFAKEAQKKIHNLHLNHRNVEKRKKYQQNRNNQNFQPVKEATLEDVRNQILRVKSRSKLKQINYNTPYSQEKGAVYSSRKKINNASQIQVSEAAKNMSQIQVSEAVSRKSSPKKSIYLSPFKQSRAYQQNISRQVSKNNLYTPTKDKNRDLISSKVSHISKISRSKSKRRYIHQESENQSKKFNKKSRKTKQKSETLLDKLTSDYQMITNQMEKSMTPKKSSHINYLKSPAHSRNSQINRYKYLDHIDSKRKF